MEEIVPIMWPYLLANCYLSNLQERKDGFCFYCKNLKTFHKIYVHIFVIFLTIWNISDLLTLATDYSCSMVLHLVQSYTIWPVRESGVPQSAVALTFSRSVWDSNVSNVYVYEVYVLFCSVQNIESDCKYVAYIRSTLIRKYIISLTTSYISMDLFQWTLNLKDTF